MNQTQNSQIILTLNTAREQTGIAMIAPLAQQAGCTISKSRQVTLNDHRASLIYVTGSWNEIAKFETLVQNLDEPDCHMSVMRTEATHGSLQGIPYTLHVIAMDAPGIVHKLLSFFSPQEVLFDEINTDTYTVSQSNTCMFSMYATLLLPVDIHIAGLRERFILFCEDENFDGIIEPQKM